MSWFSSSKTASSSSSTAGNAEGTNFWPVTSLTSGFGQLSEKDTAWACTTNKGFQTETQTWYSVLEDGSSLMCQVIWSCIGVFLVPSTTQFTFKLYNPHTKKTLWKSINATGFTVNEKDGRSCKTNEFEIKHTGSSSPGSSETYTIHANLDKTTQISIVYLRPESAPGFKYGAGEEGGYSRFGKERGDGFVIHRFHPRVQSTGQVMIDGQVVDAKGESMFVHAIQGMRPNLIASRWNFAFFSTAPGKEDEKLGSVSAIEMEFETIDDYGAKGPKSGRVKSNIGVIYSSKLGSPLLVVGQTAPSPAADVYVSLHTNGAVQDSVCRATHTSSGRDQETGYDAPLGLRYEWEGAASTEKGKVRAEVEVKTSLTPGEGGLIEKVNVLNEIPYLIRKALSSITGTKPYIFQYHNLVTLNVTLADGTAVPVSGWMFNEASFISP